MYVYVDHEEITMSITRIMIIIIIIIIIIRND
jgi:hypothetical protein